MSHLKAFSNNKQSAADLLVRTKKCQILNEKLKKINKIHSKIDKKDRLLKEYIQSINYFLLSILNISQLILKYLF